ncbi:MAG: YraN family protein [Moraxellaceae bacterium]|nr:MAG: YraN family protein [Moraxellaceae bacterium]
MPVGRSSSPTHQQGAKAEDAAAVFMQAQGYQLVAQNFNTRLGEIDLIVQRGDPLQLVFVEVRQRKVNALVSAAESITLAKQRKIMRAAQVFLQQHPQYRNHDCRFDVIAYTSALNSVSYRKANMLQTDATAGQFTLDQPVQVEWIQAAFYGV